jgi:hypothetical protein
MEDNKEVHFSVLNDAGEVESRIQKNHLSLWGSIIHKPQEY